MPRRGEPAHPKHKWRADWPWRLKNRRATIVKQIMMSIPRECNGPEAPHVYLLQQGERGPIKIGRSIEPDKRQKAAATFSAERVRIIGCFPGDFDAERKLHELFARWRSRGEMFEPVPEILDFARGLDQTEALLRASVDLPRISDRATVRWHKRIKESRDSLRCATCGRPRSSGTG